MYSRIAVYLFGFLSTILNRNFLSFLSESSAKSGSENFNYYPSVGILASKVPVCLQVKVLSKGISRF